ncbi:DUF3060 domain-containing protein [Tsukamurella pseudospumae]|uniref:DUF3060 domain-containing protein n=1 Tax=Tsukamurella pseudospumae TaxID=239498 RepID=A0A137ZSD0_9ACTN|nr:DUF3060 domain-containing protein [Tsukamurella pseudospumae]KXP01078.1 hypothetical protein AXK61_13955 [Tsukamurella pseudospumae]
MRKPLAGLAAAAAATVIAGTVAAPMASAAIELNGHDQVRTLACNDDVKLIGSDNSIVFTSNCKRVEVSGHDNTLTFRDVTSLKLIGSGNSIKLGSASSVDVSGHDNTITCSGARKPTVKSIGADNSYQC